MTATLKLGTRGSALALKQADMVRSALLAVAPDVDVEVSAISTRGDQVLDKPLEDIGDKGLFTKELERALLDGDVDLCVHSMKDMPTEFPEGCVMGGMLERADARDVLVCGPRIHAASLADVPAGARLGTGSLRRTAQIRRLFPDVLPVPMRGNVDTRLQKACGADYEGAVMAAAGLLRMGRADCIAAYLPVEQMVPAVGQGAIGIEIRDGDERMAALCRLVGNRATERCVNIERAVLSALEGGCQAPIGVHARLEGDALLVDAIVCALDGSREARAVMRFSCDDDCAAVSAAVVRTLAESGAHDILAAIASRGVAPSGGDAR